MKKKEKVVFLGGGTGTPKLIQGFRRILKDENITVIANTADDITLYGLYISPDVDTYLYLFADLLDTKKFWGIKGDTFQTFSFMKKIGEEIWFALGDKDLALHLMRTKKINEGVKLSEITSFLSDRLNVKAKIIPCTDNHIETRIITEDNLDIHFQEFWVKEKANVSVKDIYFSGIEKAEVPSEVFSEIENAEKIILGPSNPVTSIGPIISIKEIRNALRKNKEKCLGISPIIGKKAFSGPTCQFLASKKKKCAIETIIALYEDIITHFFIDTTDKQEKEKLRKAYEEIVIHSENIMLNDPYSAQELAKRILKVK